MQGLTDKQNRIYEFIKEAIRNSGFPPTVREIGDEFGITVKGAYDHLKAIEKKGFIRTEQNKSRAIIITQSSDIPPTDAVNIPLVGRIAAGLPVLADENIEDYLSFPRALIGSGDYFALKVRGDSMEEGGIFDNDIAVIRKQATANDGDIVAALLEDEATLKKFKRTGKQILLIPENRKYKPIAASEVTILGKLKAVFRLY
ncbi:MAG: transcriptional repressor LexA [Leptospirales bacterium]|nr:transcriptional repressor LexA [Leptospirales bacterium]